MIEIEGIKYRTAHQWEKMHRHVNKGQLKKGVHRRWRAPYGFDEADFYRESQTRPWSRREREEERRAEAEAAEAKRLAEEAVRRFCEDRRLEADRLERHLLACWGVPKGVTLATLGIADLEGIGIEELEDTMWWLDRADGEDAVDLRPKDVEVRRRTASGWLCHGLVPIRDARWVAFDTPGCSQVGCEPWDVRYAPDVARDLGCWAPMGNDGRPWW